jgi:pilus assembly protein Flp/PilA
LLDANGKVELGAKIPMKTLIARFASDESGATAIEYGLVAAGISVAIIAVIQGLGNNLKTAFSSLSSTLK